MICSTKGGRNLERHLDNQPKEPNSKTVQKILSWLKENGMIEIYGSKGNRKETHYNVVNYDYYQGRDSTEVTGKVTVIGQVGKQSLDTNKNDKNEKNEKTECLSVDFVLGDVGRYYQQKIGIMSALKGGE